MPACAQTETAFGYFRRIFANWRSRQALYGELAALPAGERDRLLADSQLSRSDIEAMLASDGHEETQLPRLLESCGIDPEALRRDRPAEMRDLQRVCASCEDARRCRHVLAAGGSLAQVGSFCPNAEAIAELGHPPLRS